MSWSIDQNPELGHNNQLGGEAYTSELKRNLLAVTGVLELAVVDQMIYLKVDQDKLDEPALARVKGFN